MSQRRPLHVVSFAIPVLSPREAETIIDLLGQLQGLLWDAYGDAIVTRADDHLPSGDHLCAADNPDDLPPS